MLGWGGGRNRHAGFAIRFGQSPHIRFQSRFEQTSFKSRRKHGFACVTGFRYDAEREHSSHGTVGLTFRGRPDIELGLMILDALADYLLPAVDALRRHKEYLRTHPPRRIERQVPLPP